MNHKLNFRLLANQSANWAKWGNELLKVEIQELEDLQFDLKMTGFELEKVQNFLDDLDDVVIESIVVIAAYLNHLRQY